MGRMRSQKDDDITRGLVKELLSKRKPKTPYDPQVVGPRVAWVP